MPIIELTMILMEKFFQEIDQRSLLDRTDKDYEINTFRSFIRGSSIHTLGIDEIKEPTTRVWNIHEHKWDEKHQGDSSGIGLDGGTISYGRGRRHNKEELVENEFH